MKHSFLAKVKDGELIISRKSDYKEFLSELEGKECSVSISKQRTERSISQNSAWWGVVIPMAREGLKQQGWRLSKEEVHEMILSMFSFEEKINENTGEVQKFRRGSSELSTVEFCELYAQTQQWAAEYLGVNIPSPNEQIGIEL